MYIYIRERECVCVYVRVSVCARERVCRCGMRFSVVFFPTPLSVALSLIPFLTPLSLSLPSPSLSTHHSLFCLPSALACRQGEMACGNCAHAKARSAPFIHGCAADASTCLWRCTAHPATFCVCSLWRLRAPILINCPLLHGRHPSQVTWAFLIG